MAKVKLLHFELVSLLSESKRIVDYIQKLGVADIENTQDSELLKFETAAVRDEYKKKSEFSSQAAGILEKYCNIKRGLVESFTDYKSIEYSDFRVLADKSDFIENICKEVIAVNDEIIRCNQSINEKRRLLDYYSPWSSLDIPMASKRTLSTSIFIGSFSGNYTEGQILDLLVGSDELLTEIAVDVVFSEKRFTYAVIIAHNSVSDICESVLKQHGFSFLENAAPALASKTTEKLNNEISALEDEIKKLKESLKNYLDKYDDIRFLGDFSVIQTDKYEALEKSAQTEQAFIIRGYIPENLCDEIKFDIENKFLCQIEFNEPDYDNSEVPVLIKNGAFGGGVESITNMYSTPSNKDVDPNPIMAFFYYLFFGFMLSDAGYGILMILFSIIAKKKFKVSGNSRKFANMVLFSGISTVFWGVMFGGWFGDLIPIVFTEFLGYDKGPQLALWLDPVSNSMTLLLFSLGMGILQLFAGLLIKFYMLFKEKKYMAAFSDTVPVIVFVIGFAIIGAGIIIELPEKVSALGLPLLASGAALIILTGGRSSKSIIGKFGGGLYALYNIATGYVGDILSYSRLLALSLVTGVVAGAVNMLAAMPGNIVIFVIIFIVGHVMNIAINLIGTYVHTNRLQYVEFFSKFYEGSGVEFRPLKLNSKHFIIKEEKKYE